MEGSDGVRGSFESCLAVLRCSSDEKKFVGLLLASKVLPHCDADMLRSLFEAVGVEFIHRMLLPLNTDLAVREPVEVEQNIMMIALSFSLLNAFCIPAIVSQKLHDFQHLFLAACKLWEKRDRVIQSASMTGIPTDKQQKLFSDGLDYILAFLRCSDLANLDQKLLLRCFDCSQSAMQITHHSQQSMEICSMLFSSPAANAALAADRQKDLGELIGNISQFLTVDVLTRDLSAESVDLAKLQLQALSTLAAAFSIPELPIEEIVASSKMDVRLFCVQIHSTFYLLHCLTEALDAADIFLSSQTADADSSQEVLHCTEPHRFLQICSARAQVELSLLIQDMQSPNEHIPIQSAYDTSAESRRWTELPFLFRTSGDRALHLLPVYLSITESIVGLLALQEEHENDAINSAFSDVDEAVLHLMLFIKDLSDARPSDFLQAHPYLVVGCIRLIGRFLAEAPVAHEDVTKEILPFMLHYSDGEALPFLIPALQQLTDPDYEGSEAWRALCSRSAHLPRLTVHLAHLIHGPESSKTCNETGQTDEN